MFSLKSLIAALFAAACTLPLAATAPPPTRTFTVRAYASPSPVGIGLTGYYLVAKNGNFYIQEKPPSPKPTLYVTYDGKAYLTSGSQIFLNTANGALQYTSSSSYSFPPGANTVNFLHLGSGNVVTLPGFDGPNSAQPPPAEFEWNGSDNREFFACNSTKQLYKSVNVNNVDGCDNVELAALS